MSWNPGLKWGKTDDAPAFGFFQQLRCRQNNSTQLRKHVLLLPFANSIRPNASVPVYLVVVNMLFLGCSHAVTLDSPADGGWLIPLIRILNPNSSTSLAQDVYNPELFGNRFSQGHLSLAFRRAPNSSQSPLLLLAAWPGLRYFPLHIEDPLEVMRQMKAMERSFKAF